MRALAAFALALASCVAPPLFSPPQQNQCEPSIEFNQSLRNKVDVLFMVDNSASMAPMSDELKARFQEFLKVFSQLAQDGTYADLHIGVVTSDYGAGATGAPGCNPSPGGQLGKLQAVGQFAGANCKAPMGANFIAYKFTADGSDPNNLPTGQDLAATFTCMASVGDHGCGFEHQLESVYAALHNDLPENAGFLRDDAYLAVVFVTNEDDASAPPDTDVFDKAKTAQYGYEDSYSRQTRFAIYCCPQGMMACDESQKTFPPYGASGGPLAGCESAPVPPGKQYDVSRYVDFFTLSAAKGGIKQDARDVILVAIDGPADPFNVILGNPADFDQAQCGQLNEDSNPPCVPVLQHSCQNPQDPVFFADPSVRLNYVVKQAKQSFISSICDSDFTGALQGVGELIKSKLVKGCLPFNLSDHPDCVVEDVIGNQDGTTTVNVIPACDSPPTAYPCWTIDPSTDCSQISPQGVALNINRNGQTAPAHTVAKVACGTDCQ